MGYFAEPVTLVDLCLPVRVLNALKNEGITEIAQVEGMTPSELRRLPYIGPGAVQCIIEGLEFANKRLKQNEPVLPEPERESLWVRVERLEERVRRLEEQS